MAKAQKAQEQARFQGVQISRFSGRLLAMKILQLSPVPFLHSEQQFITQSASQPFRRINSRYDEQPSSFGVS